MAIILYGEHASPPCLNVMLVAKAINLPITFKQVDLEKGENTTEAFLKKNPAHTVPVLEDNGHTLWESRAIVTYIIDKYANDDSLYPKDAKKRSQVDNIMYFDATSLYAGIANYFYPPIIYGKKVDIDRLVILQDKLSIFDRILSQRPYAAGNSITVADLCLINSITVPEVFGLPLGDYPHVTKWAEKARKQLPFYDNTTKRGVTELKAFAQNFPKK